MGYFAHITGLSAYTDTVSGTTVEGYKATVDNVIVAEQAFIDSGVVGDPKTWIETYLDGSLRSAYAGKTYIYDSIKDAFYSQPPFPSWVLKQVITEISIKGNKDLISKWKWVAPIDRPAGDVLYDWDETVKNWVPVALNN